MLGHLSNAPAHNSKETKMVLKELGIEVLDRSPYSPDLNVIEVVWAIMEKKMKSTIPTQLMI